MIDFKFITNSGEEMRMTEGKSGLIIMSKMYKRSGVTILEENDEDTIEVKTYPSEVVVGTVSFNEGVTINLGDFNSVKLGVHVTLPCVPEELEDAFQEAKRFVEFKVNEEAKKIRDERAK